ncbi:MAG TPA: hypothetical protein VHS97_20930, partial [Isosphaeraceae bacterium]|nr:hypothetical protein [Isosphaeraceae bacterium]
MPMLQSLRKVSGTSSPRTLKKPGVKTSASSAPATLPSQSLDRPIFWIVAGPNGSGKSTAYEDADIEAFARSVWIINPDALTRRIQRVEGQNLAEANLEAVKRIEIWLDASIQAHQTVGVETVLSTDKYRRL